VLFDVDGVLTDGAVLIHADGFESKRFHVRDGAAIMWAHRAGLLTGMLSARPSPATAERASQLGMQVVVQTEGDKLAAYERILREHRLIDEHVAFMGDDLLDLPVLCRVGLAAAPADAAPEVRRRAHLVTRARGGHGAARELLEVILKARKAWPSILRQYGGPGGR
jgi:3-deoxy-D-manno-octulosonate 8-phosphate phosphatase (KDO 8-P phosphatase)